MEVPSIRIDRRKCNFSTAHVKPRRKRRQSNKNGEKRLDIDGEKNSGLRLSTPQNSPNNTYEPPFLMIFEKKIVWNEEKRYENET